MASDKTYLAYCNDIISELNEVQLTTVVSQTAFSGFITKAVLSAVRDVNNAELEWPFNVASGAQTLTPGIQEYSLPTGTTSVDWESFVLRPLEQVTNGAFASAITSWTDISSGTGSVAHTTDGDGRARLAAGSSGVGAITQSLSTIANTKYRVITRIFTGGVTLNIGTTSGGTEISSTSLTITNAGEGTSELTEFTATGATTYISLSHTTNANHDVDFVSVIDDLNAVLLEYLQYDIWIKYYPKLDYGQDPDTYALPNKVIRTQNEKFAVTPIPDKTTYSVEFFYWTVPTDMSVDASTCTIPDRYQDVVKQRALYYAYRFREDIESAREAKKEYTEGLFRMRTEMIDKPSKMYLQTNYRYGYNGSTTG